MSRRMVVAAVAATGVVGFGSAAVATVGPLGSGDVADALPGAVKNVQDKVSQGVDTDIVDIPGQAGSLEQVLADLRGELQNQSIAIAPQSPEASAGRLAAAMDDLAERIRAGSAQLSEAQRGGADQAADKLEGAAAKVRSASFPAPGDSAGGSAGARGEVAAEDGSASVSGGGAASSDNGGATVSGGGTVSGEQALTQVMDALAYTQELDQTDAFSSAGVDDVLDSERVNAALRRVTVHLNGLLG